MGVSESCSVDGKYNATLSRRLPGPLVTTTVMVPPGNTIAGTVSVGTGLIVWESSTGSAETRVAPPVAPVRLTSAPLVIDWPLSIKLTLSAVASPL